MIPKIIKTIFLALGLAMVWLGFLYHYELTQQQEKEAELKKESSGGLETYTLSNDAYSEEAIEELQFKNMDNKEKTLIYSLADFPETEKAPEEVNTAGYLEDFQEYDDSVEAEVEESEKDFPIVLAGGGILFLLIGFFSFRL